MSDSKGPTARRRRTTISGSGGAGSVKQANGFKGHDAGAKPPQYPAGVKTPAAAAEVSKLHTSHNGNVDNEESEKKQQQSSKSPRKQRRSAMEDVNDRLR